MENTDLLEFLSYLMDRNNQLEKELEPYYEEVSQREERHQNSYGVGTPRERELLMESGTIYRLKKKVSNVSSIEELVASIEAEQKLENTEEEAQTFLSRELAFIEKYKNLNQKKEEPHHL